MSRPGREKRLGIVAASVKAGVDSDSPVVKTCIGQTRAGHPCGSFTVQGSDWCFSHSPDVTDAERKAAWRLGGLTSTAALAEADVQPVSLRTRAEVAAARERVYALTLSRVLSSAVASALLTALEHADRQRDRAESLAIDRCGRHRPESRIVVEFAPWLQALAEARRPALTIPTQALPVESDAP